MYIKNLDIRKLLLIQEKDKFSNKIIFKNNYWLLAMFTSFLSLLFQS